MNAALALRDGMRTHERKRGAASKLTSVRFPQDLVEQIGADGGGYGQSFASSVVRLLDLATDAIKAMGEDALRTELQLRAIREQITEGEALGRYAREAIERERGGSKDRKGRGR